LRLVDSGITQLVAAGSGGRRVWRIPGRFPPRARLACEAPLGGTAPLNLVEGFGFRVEGFVGWV